jgi:hypothetical protein
METWIVVFLGVIALGALVQIAFFAVLAFLGLRAIRFVKEAGEQARRELALPMAHLTEATSNLKDISGILAAEAHTLRATADETKRQIQETKENVRRAVRSPWVEVQALAKGVARGFSVLRDGHNGVAHDADELAPAFGSRVPPPGL